MKRLYAVMSTHPTSTRVQCFGCAVLGYMSSGSPPPGMRPDWACRALLGVAMVGTVADAIVLSGGLSRLYAAMDAHRSSEDVLGFAFGTLASLSNSSGTSNRNRILHTGGIPRVFRAMAAHPRSEEVQVATLFALQELVVPEAKTAMLVTDENIVHVYAAMAAHPTAEGVQQGACGVLANLAGPHAFSQKQLGTRSRLEHVYAAMAAHPRSESVQAIGCELLGNLSLGDNAIPIASKGGLDRIYAAMAAFPGSHTLQETALVALLNLSNIEAIVSIMKAGRAVALIREANAAHPRNSVVQADCRELLTRLA